MPRLNFWGASMDAKWYWPPAVGYTLASSAKELEVLKYATVVNNML